ncbi:MAG: hypothetical protein DVB25_06340 [Verrucomicrobia bacterium]|nr:MAG: hypothetical protein DVB25_06340 [Verrucomicrobiota bacterium]
MQSTLSTSSEPAPTDSLIRSASEGRLRFTPAQRQELLDAFDRSGLSTMAFARSPGVCYQTFIARQRKRRDEFRTMTIDWQTMTPMIEGR